LPLSSINITMLSRLNTAHGFCPAICVPSMRLADAAHRRPVSCSSNALAAVTKHGNPALVGTAVAHNVKITKPRFGWIGNRPNFYRLTTLWLPLRCLLNSDSWHGTTRQLVYNLLFACVSSTLKDFGLNPKNLGANIGMTAILHTHNRRLDYHPHIHVVVPGGGVDKARKQWKKKKDKYLFNEFASGQGLSCPISASIKRSRTVSCQIQYPANGWSIAPMSEKACPL
jgi:hypothetical protein